MSLNQESIRNRSIMKTKAIIISFAMIGKIINFNLNSLLISSFIII